MEIKTQIVISKSDLISYIESIDSNFIAYEDIRTAIDQLKIEVQLRPDLKIVK